MIRDAIEPGNILRNHWPEPAPNTIHQMYIGNGKLGCCIDLYGLMNKEFNQTGIYSSANTALLHADHWTRADYGMDFYLPVGRVCWKGRPQRPLFYQQKLTLYDGFVSTHMQFVDCEWILNSWTSHIQQDLLAYEAIYNGDPSTLPALQWVLMQDFITSYEIPVKAVVIQEDLDNDHTTWSALVQAGTARTLVTVKLIVESGSAVLVKEDHGVSVRASGEQGRFLLLIAIGSLERRAEVAAQLENVHNIDAFRQASIESWHTRWGDAYVQVSDPQVQAMWARSLYYLLATYAPGKHSPPSPTGWSGNGWAFHFPQDLSYIHPVFLRLGHLDIAKSIVEFYHSRLEDMVRNTRRIYQAEGAMWAWEFPIGKDFELFVESAPDHWCPYEIHNAAYPARMAYETALYLTDPDWSREIAWPVVLESARFYASKLSLNEGGTYSLIVEPSFGQDEFGGHNQKNYLCSLFSAQYSLQTALKMADQLGVDFPEKAKLQAILAKGLAYDRLEIPELGIYSTVETSGARFILGSQKHPVQLNPLMFLPLGAQPSSQTVRAYRMRSEICGDIRFNRSNGWTLPSFWLASAHLRDTSGLFHYINKAREMRYADQDLIQFFESSGGNGMPFYTTSHGLFLQAVNDSVVSDYWGRLEIGASFPLEWGRVKFVNLRTCFGDKLTGQREHTRWVID